MTPAEYLNGAGRSRRIIDTNPRPVIPGATYVDLTQNKRIDLKKLVMDEPLLLVCTREKQAYFLQNRLKYYRYQNMKVLEGGVTFNEVHAFGQ